VEKVEETLVSEEDPFSGIGIIFSGSVLKEATHIVVWFQTIDFESGEIRPWRTLMEFPITEEQKEQLAKVEPGLLGVYISCEQLPY